MDLVAVVVAVGIEGAEDSEVASVSQGEIVSKELLYEVPLVANEMKNVKIQVKSKSFKFKFYIFHFICISSATWGKQKL